MIHRIYFVRKNFSLFLFLGKDLTIMKQNKNQIFRLENNFSQINKNEHFPLTYLNKYRVKEIQW
jgi:hypothetical protein